MKTTRLVVTSKNLMSYNGDLLVFFAIQQKKTCPACDDLVKPSVEAAFELGDFSGKPTQHFLFYPSREDLKSDISAKRVLVVGLGSPEDDDTDQNLRDILRAAGGHVQLQLEGCL